MSIDYINAKLRMKILALPPNLTRQTRWRCWRRGWSRRRSSSGWRCRCGAWSGHRPEWSCLGGTQDQFNKRCLFIKIMQQIGILRILPVFTLLIASLLISLKSSRMSTTKPNEYVFIFWRNFWSRKCLDFWRSERRAYLRDCHQSEQEKWPEYHSCVIHQIET